MRCWLQAAAALPVTCCISANEHKQSHRFARHAELPDSRLRASSQLPHLQDLGPRLLVGVRELNLAIQPACRQAVGAEG